MAATPNRGAAGAAGAAGGRIPGQGYYADASSPIASTPNRGRATPAKVGGAPPTPSLAALSPMKQPKERPLQRAEGAGAAAGGPAAEGEKTYLGAIFSPVLKYFGSEEETKAAEAAAAAASAEGAGGRSAGGAGAGAAGRAGLGVGAGSGGAGSRAGGTSTLPLSPQPGGRSSSSGSGGGGGASGAAAAAARPPMSEEAQRAAAIVSTAQAGAAAAAAAALAAGATTATMVAPPPPQEYEEFNPYLFIKMLPAYHQVSPTAPRIALPKKKRGMPEVNLVLDLDETLVHCSVEPIPDADVFFPVNFNGANYQVYVRKRPHLDKFFALIAGKFEVTVFTASQQVYAERLLNLLDPEGKHIHNRLYRDSCLNVDGNFLKDLNVLGRDLTKTVLVDNSPHAFGYQLDNGIPIESWFDDKKDTELLKLASFVHTLLGQDDVRSLVRDRFRLQSLVDSSQVPPGWT